MAHPSVYPKKTFFYPVGNTPSVSLTKHLPPEENAEILLLGCGDVRHILHTVRHDKANTTRVLDLTCCDWESAVLARNTLLLTMLADGIEPTILWEIFYHIFIDDPSFRVLIDHCSKLLSLSSDINSWNASSYGRFIRFCDENSLKEVRQKWQSYVELSKESLLARKKAEFVKEMKKVFEKFNKSVHSSARAVGPLVISYLGRAHESYDYYWTHGMVKSASYKPTRTTKVNPTFVYTSMGDSFNVHYGTNPLACFHLTSAGVPIKNTTSSPSLSLESVTTVAVNQFVEHCNAFRDRLRLKAPNIVIRLFCGETLAFCRALLVLSQTRSTRTNVSCTPWKLATIHFSDIDYAPESTTPAPTSFGLIDTSNLADHLGLLNVLISTIPLLQHKPYTTLNTNILVTHNPDVSILDEKICGDLPTLSLFLGVAPTFHLSHTTCVSNKHELLMAAATSVASPALTQRHELLEWRIPDAAISSSNSNSFAAPSVPRCDSKKLASFLLSVYRKMFSSEDLQSLLSANKTTMASWLHTASLPHYSRESFVSLLALIKGRIDTNWNDVIDILQSSIQTDTSLLMGANNFQDLACQLYLRNIFTFDTFRPPLIESLKKPAMFQKWQSIPPVLVMILEIPRSALAPLEEGSLEEIGTPFLECETQGRGLKAFHNVHSSIFTTFGNVNVSGVDDTTRATITEDTRGMDGKSPLIVYFYIPSWILVAHADTLQVGLKVKTTPHTTMSLLPKLGINLRIFATRLKEDGKQVYIVRERPGTTGDLSELQITPPSLISAPHDKETPPPALINFSDADGTVASLTIRHSLEDDAVKQALRSGASVQTLQIGNRSMQISLQGYKKHLLYPFPIVGDKAITRVARKSLYVEVQVPIRRRFDNVRDLTTNPFPITHWNSRPCLYNVPYIQLDYCQKLDVARLDSDIQWLSVHLGMMMSESERYLQTATDISQHGPLINIKESIATILARWCGFEAPEQRFNVFGLKNPMGDVGIYTLIFVNDIVLDTSSQTIVGDACVVPITEDNVELLAPIFQQVSGPKLTQIITHDEEMHLWRRILPALAERCRTWKHKGTCEYLSQGIPRVITSFEASPLCSCGLGKDLGPFGQKREFAAGFRHATRIAIGPIFSHSSMDDAFKKMKDKLGSSLSSAQSTPARCANCKGPGKPSLLSCSVCKKVRYCTRDCQKQDWKQHKRQCKA